MYASIFKSYSTFTLQYALFPLLVLSVILHRPFLRPVTTPLLESLTIPYLFIVYFFVSVVFFGYTVAFSAYFLPTFSVSLLRLSLTLVAILSLTFILQVVFLPFFV